MNFYELISRRESCRNFSSTPVDIALLKDVLEAARLAPSARNDQPWNFYIVNSPESVEKVKDGITKLGRNTFAPEVPAYIVITRNGFDDDSWNPEFPYSHRYDVFDCGIASAHVVLAATEKGLSTCMIGWFDDEILKSVCGYEDETALLVFAIGYAADDKLRNKTRRSIDEVVKVV